MKSNSDKPPRTYRCAKIVRGLTLLAVVLAMFSHTANAKPRTCRIVYPERTPDSPKTAYLFDGDGSRSVNLPSMNFSEVIELPNGPLTLAMSRDEVTDPKLLPADVPLLRIPETVKDFYIILSPDPSNQHLPVKLNLVSTDKGDLGEGETLWFNLTRHRIAAKLGNSELTVDPQDQAISKDPIPASGYYTAKFAYQASGTGAYAPITEQSWWHDSTSRHLGFIASTGGKLPTIYFYRDYRNPNAAEDSAQELKESAQQASDP